MSEIYIFLQKKYIVTENEKCLKENKKVDTNFQEKMLSSSSSL